MRQEIDININELILEGFDTADKYAIADALARELESLLHEQGLNLGPDSSMPLIDKLNAGSITLRQGRRGASIGSQLGRAVFNSLNASTAPAVHAEPSPVQMKSSGKSA